MRLTQEMAGAELRGKQAPGGMGEMLSLWLSVSREMSLPAGAPRPAPQCGPELHLATKGALNVLESQGH